METELRAVNDSRKSFYGKAGVRYEGDKIILRSYSTDVAYIENGRAIVNGYYSNTTLRHIKEFLKQNGFEADSWKQIEEDYMVTVEEEAINKEKEEEKANSIMKTVSTIASLGDIFTDTKKESNDWKLRMLKAGLENRGLCVPEDWDTLTEEEKQKRLDGVIAIANKEAV
jgi:hypothetical protein